jgi:hypothetical protein
VFILLLAVTFLVALAVAVIVVRVFSSSIEKILARIIADDISQAWARYVKFAIYVVCISGGVRVWELERYITGQSPRSEALQLTPERWVLEVYRTVIGTLQSAAWLLLIFFLVSLIAYAVSRFSESIKSKS